MCACPLCKLSKKAQTSFGSTAGVAAQTWTCGGVVNPPLQCGHNFTVCAVTESEEQVVTWLQNHSCTYSVVCNMVDSARGSSLCKWCCALTLCHYCYAIPRFLALPAMFVLGGLFGYFFYLCVWKDILKCLVSGEKHRPVLLSHA